jgi:hypothetical protein
VTTNIAIRLALGGLLLAGAAACDGDEKAGATGTSSSPASGSSATATAGTPSPAQAGPS